MRVFQHVLQVCCYISVMIPINSYVLFAANVDDFRNLAKKFIPDDLAEKLTDLVSQNGGKSGKDRVITNEHVSIKQNVRERTEATVTDITMYQIRGGKNNNQDEHSNQKSKIEFEYDEIHNAKINEKPSTYHENATIQNINVRKRPVRLEPKPYEKRFKVRPPIQVRVEFDDEQQNTWPKIKPTVNFQTDRITSAYMKKRPTEDVTQKKRLIHNQQETLQDDYLEDNVYKKSNFESRFDNAEQKNSYVNKMPAYQNGDRPKRYTKFAHDSRFESEEFVTEGKQAKNKLTTANNKRHPQLNYDYDDITTKFVTLEEKRYITVRSRINNKNTQHLNLKLKETFSRAATPKQPLSVKPKMRDRILKERQKQPPTVTIPERDYDMRQKVTPVRKVEFGNRNPISQGRENEMRIHSGREIRDRKRQKQKSVEDDQSYEKTYPPKLTNNDYDLPYERPQPTKPTKNHYDPYDRPHPPKPTKNDYNVSYKKPYPAKPTKNDYDVSYKKPYPAKPTKNDYDLSYENPNPSKPTKNDYDLPYEKPYPSKSTKNNYDPPYKNPYPTKPTINEYDLYYEKNNPSKPTNNDYDLYYEKSHMSQPTTSNNDKIFLTKQNTPVKDDDYFDDDTLKPTVKIQRMPSANIQHKQTQKDDIFTSYENPSVPSIKNKKIIDNLDAKRPVANEKSPVINEKRPIVNEEEQDMYEEVVHEPVKARTESLNFDIDYDNNTDRIRTTRHIMKGTGIPIRQTFKMSSPDYYKRLPRIVEKYDFNEPIPEGDREREVPNDKLVLEPGIVNKKVKQQNQDIFKEVHEERPEFEPIKGHNENKDSNDQQGAIMEEYSLIR